MILLYPQANHSLLEIGVCWMLLAFQVCTFIQHKIEFQSKIASWNNEDEICSFPPQSIANNSRKWLQEQNLNNERMNEQTIFILKTIPCVSDQIFNVHSAHTPKEIMLLIFFFGRRRWKHEVGQNHIYISVFVFASENLF